MATERLATKLETRLDRFNVTVIGKINLGYYVYVYWANDVPFYVGKGTNTTGKTPRFAAHLNTKTAALNSRFRRKLLKLQKQGIPIYVEIAYCSTVERRVLMRERFLIKKYGKINDGGTLTNLTDGGDGGNTYNGRVRYYNLETGKTKAFFKGRQPKGWLLGDPPTKRLPKVVCYNAATGELTRVHSVSDIPKGFVAGGLPGVTSGPKGKIIIHHKKTKVLKWVLPSECIPKGWARGRGTKSSTAGRTAYHDPISGKKMYVESGNNPPEGYIKGTRPTSNKIVLVNSKKFPSIKAAADFYNITRYELHTNSKYTLAFTEN